MPHWPPYYAPALNSKIGGPQRLDQATKQIIFSDQPWAVAWYADRISIWLPPTYAGFEKLETIAADLQTPVAGILISPSSHGSGPLAEVAAQYKDFTSLVLDGRCFYATYPSGQSPFMTRIRKSRESPNAIPTASRSSAWTWFFYSDRAIRGPPTN